MFFFFFKQKTAYDMRISDWSSDVCSSDLTWARPSPPAKFVFSDEQQARMGSATDSLVSEGCVISGGRIDRRDRKWVVWGKSVSVRVDLGGRSIIKKKKHEKDEYRYLTNENGYCMQCYREQGRIQKH